MHRTPVSTSWCCPGAWFCCNKFAAMLFTESSTLRRDTEMHGNYKKSDIGTHTYIGTYSCFCLVCKICTAWVNFSTQRFERYVQCLILTPPPPLSFLFTIKRNQYMYENISCELCITYCFLLLFWFSSNFFLFFWELKWELGMSCSTRYWSNIFQSGFIIALVE